MNTRVVHLKSGTKARVFSDDSIEYVIPVGNGWVVKNSDSTKFTLITDSKQEAIAIARSRAKAKHRQLIVHGKNGNIEKQESYVELGVIL